MGTLAILVAGRRCVRSRYDLPRERSLSETRSDLLRGWMMVEYIHEHTYQSMATKPTIYSTVCKMVSCSDHEWFNGLQYDAAQWLKHAQQHVMMHLSSLAGDN